MSWNGKKVLVTGAGGFIGSHLVQELVKFGADVRAMIRYNSSNSWGNLEFLDEEIKAKIEVVAGDIRDPFFVRKAAKGCETVFHLAALIAIPYSYLAPKDFVDTNIIGTTNVMQACVDEQVRKVVHTSTSEVYGTAQYVPIDEKHPLVGQSPYSASKIGADKIAESYYCSFNLPVATVRPFNTFGPRQSARAVIPTIISQALSGAKKIKLGSLDPVRDFTYVKDTASAFIKVAESEKTIGETLNAGTGQGRSIGQVADMIMQLSKVDAQVVSDSPRMRPEKSEVMRLLCDNRKILKLAGWKPRYTIEDGLKDTIDYIRQNITRYKPNIYNL